MQQLYGLSEKEQRKESAGLKTYWDPGLWVGVDHVDWHVKASVARRHAVNFFSTLLNKASFSIDYV